MVVGGGVVVVGVVSGCGEWVRWVVVVGEVGGGWGGVEEVGGVGVGWWWVRWVGLVW